MVVRRNRFGQFADQGLGRGSIDARSVGRSMGYVYRQTVDSTFQGVTVSMREAVEGAIVEATGAVQEDIQLFAAALRNKTRRNRDSRPLQINEQAGRAAQTSVLREYSAQHGGRGSGNPSVSKSRMANGALKRALADPSFYQARWDGVAIINRKTLDRTAKQWYRLNFGAGAAGVTDTRPPGRYQVEFFNQTGVTATLRGNRPSSPFAMPAGIFVIRGSNFAAGTGRFDSDGRQIVGAESDGVAPGTHDFIASSGRNTAILKRIENLSKQREDSTLMYTVPRKVTRGIQGSNFLDAGVSSLVRNLERGWTVLMYEWFTEALNSGTGPVAERIRLDGTNPDISASLARISESKNNIERELNRFKSGLR